MGDFSRRTWRVSLRPLRRNYEAAELTEQSADPDPVQQFNSWFTDAQAADLIEPNAMVVSTSTLAGKPSARVVLLKEFGNDGFTFYTNYLSRKGRELEANPLATLTFYWGELERQIRIEGTVSKTERSQSEEYFSSRPRASRLGAWVSQQSDVVSNRENIEATLKELEERFSGNDDIPAPEHWGGYRLDPELFEFWQGRPNRLHDRLVYRRSSNGWIMERLWP
ncbi:MAG TPA: pyridoxamine 5'-phosphate oxidase [Bryobacteraceae bacterium]|jgi:pyridoxamine 5'-phosphate oxidase|nr:pyridoxamine 5'-phosphate oxidase [Bryobacteraceae bacterium]